MNIQNKEKLYVYYSRTKYLAVLRITRERVNIAYLKIKYWQGVLLNFGLINLFSFITINMRLGWYFLFLILTSSGGVKILREGVAEREYPWKSWCMKVRKRAFLVHSPGFNILLCSSCVVCTHNFYLIEIIKPTKSTNVVWVRSDGQTALWIVRQFHSPSN